ncbi:MAG: GNAT family N-acetyltransferase [Pseudomonadota bacterium]
MIPDGYHDIPPGKIAAVVTLLEMRAPAPPRDRPAPEGVSLIRLSNPDPEAYRQLFTLVGADWLWFSRLQLSDAALTDILTHPDYHAYAVTRDGRQHGLMELNFRVKGACELAYFGLGPALVGTGTGAWLMDQAIALAWSHPITRFHLHTCSLDHPGALAFYIRTGFTPTGRKIEIATDPRLTGDVDPSRAPHVPIIRPA